jgi:hypothetical protein
LLRALSARVARGEGVIKHGPAAGLRFDRPAGTAVTSSEGFVTISDPDGYRDKSRIGGDEGEQVAAVTIDSWRERTGSPLPAAMKIDVEGAELAVLDGALGTIRLARPVLLVEVHWIGLQFVEFVEDELLALGYVARSLEGGPLPREPARFHASLTRP